jgi:hypothetical protein
MILLLYLRPKAEMSQIFGKYRDKERTDRDERGDGRSMDRGCESISGYCVGTTSRNTQVPQKKVKPGIATE